MQDLREELLKKFERIIVNKIPDEYIQVVSNCMLCAIEEYEISNRCTDIIIPENTNASLVKQYSANLLISGRSNNTIEQYIKVIGSFSEFIEKDFTEAKAIDLRRYIAYKMTTNTSDRTCETYRSYINSFYNWLANEEYIGKNPMLKVKPIKFYESKEEPFSDIELSRIRDCVTDVRQRAIVEFLLSTGVRASELCDMKLEDVNFVDLSVRVVHGKGNKERVTFMTQPAKFYLEKYISSRNYNSEYLFCNNRGGGQMKVSNMSKMLNNISNASGVKNIHPHRFRHTFASRLAKAGMQPQEIQILLGHSDLNTTMIYVSTQKDTVKNSYMKYSA